jgi:hypothetical protein
MSGHREGFNVLLIRLCCVCIVIGVLSDSALAQSHVGVFRLELERADTYPNAAIVTLTLVNTTSERLTFFGTHPSRRQPLLQHRVGTHWKTPPIYLLAGGSTYLIEPFERIEVTALVSYHRNGEIVRVGVILGEYEPIVWSDPFVLEQPRLELPLATQVGSPRRPSRAEIEAVVGRHVETVNADGGPTNWLYSVRGVGPFSVMYDDNDHVTTAVVGGTASSRATVDELLELLAPGRARGRLLTTRTTQTSSSCYTEIEYDYELVTVLQRRDACDGEQELAWSVVWK